VKEYSQPCSSKKRFKYKRNMEVGDVMLRRDETAALQTHKYAQVARIHVVTDGMVRSARRKSTSYLEKAIPE
jgi:hypothetical protein